jgi:hypothetical protein
MEPGLFSVANVDPLAMFSGGYLNLNDMSNGLQELNLLIKQEADEILYRKGLLDVLSPFGKPHVHGSYSLDLMTWRDLDIYLETDTLSETQFFAIGERVCKVFSPVKMSFRNERKANTPGLPHGLYWGIYLGNERAGAWKIDIWAVSTTECHRLLKYGESIKQKLDADMIQRILEIKSACWNDAEYRRSYSSSDIYTAVSEEKVTSIEEFKKYVATLKLQQ